MLELQIGNMNIGHSLFSCLTIELWNVGLLFLVRESGTESDMMMYPNLVAFLIFIFCLFNVSHVRFFFLNLY